MRKTLFGFTIVFIIVLFLQISLVSNVHAESDWPTYQNDLVNSGFSNSEAQDTSNVRWKYESWEETFWQGAPIVADGKVFAPADEFLFCFNANNGEKLWTFETPWHISGSAAYYQGKIYLISDGEMPGEIQGMSIFCLDANTGNTIWKKNDSFNRAGDSSPKIMDNRLYVCLKNGIFCFDSNSGVELWNFSDFYNWFESTPAIYESKIFFGSWSGKIYCFDAEEGYEIWNFSTEYIVQASPSIYNNRIYIGSHDNTFYCLDVNTGNQIWNFTTGDEIWSSAAIVDGKVYFGSRDEYLYCLNSEDGEEIWTYDAGFDVDTSVLAADGKVFFGTPNHKTYCVNASNGQKIWEFTSTHGSGGPEALALAKGRLYICDIGLYCIGEGKISKDNSSTQTPGFESLGMLFALFATVIYFRKNKARKR